MADIKKTLRVGITLDSESFKQQLEELKGDIGKRGGIGKTPEGTAKGFQEEFRNEKKIQQERQRGLKQEYQMKGSAAKNFYDSNEQREKKFNQYKVQEREKEWRDINGRHEKLQRRLKENVKEVARLNASPVAQAARAMGMSESGARGVAGGMESLGERFTSRLPKPLRILGGVGAVGELMGQGMNDWQDLRMMQAQRQFAFSKSLTNKQTLSGAVGQAGRQELLPKVMGGAGGAVSGAVKYGAMGAIAGSLLGPVGTAVGGALGVVGGGIYGAIKGGTAASEKQAKLRQEQVAPILEAVDRAQALAPSRLELAQGGGLSSAAMTGMQGAGVNSGFSPEETIAQALTARQFLGNKATENALPGLQEMQRTANVDVGLGAAASETMAGATHGKMGSGVQKQIDIIKKGVSTGLDISKSGQFLKATMDYVQQSAGMGGIDVDAISERIARSAQASAGGGDVTAMDIQRATSLEALTKKESTAEGGFAGIGNIDAIQKALGPNADPGKFMAAMNLSSNATVEDTMSSLDISKEQAQQLLAAKQTAQKSGLAMATGGDKYLTEAFGGKESGMTTEQYLGRQRMEAGQGAAPAVDATGALAGAKGQIGTTPEMQKAVADAAVAQTQVVAGLNQFATVTKLTTEGLGKLNEALKISADRLKEFVGQNGEKVNLQAGE